MAKAKAILTRRGRGGKASCLFRLGVALLAVHASGCSLLASTSTGSTRSSRGWLSDGSLAISRPVPAVNVSSSARASLRPESISEQTVRPTTTVLRVGRAAGKISIDGPNTPSRSFNAQVASTLRSGRYTIALKQANPLWYAPASYFKQRALHVPPEGSRERFKRGALGNQALFLNDQTPIHSGPVGTTEIGGLRINPRDMNELFELIQIGTVVEIR